jgi:peptide/nickel transport system ATP-binding protein
MSDILLEVTNLTKHFKTPRGMLHAVDGVNFSIERGKTLGIVGESGCGKSTIGRCILRLIEPTSGTVKLEGVDLSTLSNTQMRKARKDIQIIFQDPFSSLDPRKTVLQSISEPIKEAGLIKGRVAIEKRVLQLMDTVGLAERLINTYPHELDGGRRQRIGIARALAMEPKLIVCDEPVSALDVSIQAQILNLLEELQEEFGLTYIFITHDLSVVNHFSDDIAVMYLGKMVEMAPADELFITPLHPYTKALLSAIPIPDLRHKKERTILQGEITSPINPPNQCRFLKRCTAAFSKCEHSLPELCTHSDGHLIACHLYDCVGAENSGTPMNIE